MELTVATTIMALIAGAMGALAMGVQQSTRYNQGRSLDTQHARVIIERIQRNVEAAYATADHPGVASLATTVGSYRYPDILVVWKPTNGVPTNPSGLPLIKECIFYLPDPSAPNQLLELTAPNDTRTIPLDSTLNTATWRTNIQNLAAAATSKKIVLTKLLRTAAAATGTNGLRGAARFEVELRPTAAEYTAYKAGAKTWEDMLWPQSIYSKQTGLRQTWMRMEIQLLPEELMGVSTTTVDQGIPFFGSASVWYPVAKS